MCSWTGGNDEIFDLMQKVHGWGRIHCVNQIDPANRLIKNGCWIMAVGKQCRTSLFSIDRGEKCDLADQIVREDLSQGGLGGITLIIDGLMAEGPVAGISRLEDRRVVCWLSEAGVASR